MTETLAGQSPQEIDAQLAELHQAKAKATGRVESAWTAIHWAANDKGHYVSRGRSRQKVWAMSHAEARDKVAEIAQHGAYDSHQAQQALERLAEWEEAVETFDVKIIEINTEFNRRGGWSRFFMVPGGHIHSSLHCSTCRPTTQFGWLPELSGQTEADAVAEHGALLCTVCYPSAPVEWRNFYELQEQAKADANCPGSGRYYDDSLPHRKGYYTGNWATCPECGEGVTLTSGLKLRKHQKKGS